MEIMAVAAEAPLMMSPAMLRVVATSAQEGVEGEAAWMLMTRRELEAMVEREVMTQLVTRVEAALAVQPVEGMELMVPMLLVMALVAMAVEVEGQAPLLLRARAELAVLQAEEVAVEGDQPMETTRVQETQAAVAAAW